MDTAALKPTWASSTFLQYLGTLFALGSLGSLFTVLQDEHGTGGLLGWSVLALLLLVVLAEAAKRRRQPIVAGLGALVAVLCWAVVAGSLLEVLSFDLLPDTESSKFFGRGLGADTIVLEGLVFAGAALALARFRFPLLVLPLAAVAWYAAVDLLEGVLGGGDSATAILALLVGLVFVAVAAALDVGEPHPYAFWLHVVGGLSVGGGILWFWHEHTWEWLLVLVVSLGYIAVSRALGRTSYTVLGAIGLAGTATYFIERWFSLGSLVPFFPAEPEDVDKWGRPLVYLALGAAFVVLGIAVERRRSEPEARTESPSAVEPEAPAEPAPPAAES